MTYARTRASMVAAACLLAFVGAMALSGSPPARAQGSTVGVVDFYAPSPLGEFTGLTPERYAADDLSTLLARASEARLSVVPRSTMQQAQRAMRWQGVDVLHFARLRALAQAVGADRLVVGWIPLLVVGAGSNTGVPPDGEGPPFADATLVLQVFDQAQGRLVGETLQRAGILGMDRSKAAASVLHDALQRALPAVLRSLGAAAP